MISRLARWWLLRKGLAVEAEVVDASEWMPTGQCVCGKEVMGSDWHIVVAIPDDDEDLGIAGSTAMSADFCADHCPGGCRLGCAKVEA